MSGETFFLLVVVINLFGSAILYLFVLTATRLLKVNSEMKSWLWLSVCFSCLILPLQAIVFEYSGELISSNAVAYDATTAISSTAVNSFAQVITDYPTVSEFWFYFAKSIDFIFILWCCGSFWLLARLIYASYKDNKIVYAASELNFPFEQGTSSNIKIKLSSEKSTPMVVGLFNPTIVLPESVTEYPNDKISAIIEHEKAHIVRNDIFFSLIQALISSLFWWNPILKLINFEVNLNRELACDQRAINKGTNRKYYAQILLDSAQMYIKDRYHSQSQGFFSKKKLFTTRLEEVLVMNTNKISNTFVTIGFCCFVVLGSAATAHSTGAGKELSEFVLLAKNANDINTSPTLVDIPNWLEQLDSLAVEANISVEKIDLRGPAKTTINGSVVNFARDEFESSSRELVKRYMLNINAQHGMDVQLKSLKTSEGGAHSFEIEIPLGHVSKKIVMMPLVKGLQIDKISSDPIWARVQGIVPTKLVLSNYMRSLGPISDNVRLMSIRKNKNDNGLDFVLRVEPLTLDK